MLIFILAIVVLLVAWSLHLMQQAVDRNEFSLMLAGTLVAFSAAAMVAVYFLMGNYIGYVAGMTHATAPHLSSSDVVAWILDAENNELSVSFPTVQPEPVSAYQTDAASGL